MSRLLLVAFSLREFEETAVRVALDALRRRNSSRLQAVKNEERGNARGQSVAETQPPDAAAAAGRDRGGILAALKRDLGSKEEERAMKLFDTALFTAHAERAYALMWEVHKQTGKPRHIVVAHRNGEA